MRIQTEKWILASQLILSCHITLSINKPVCHFLYIGFSIVWEHRFIIGRMACIKKRWSERKRQSTDYDTNVICIWKKRMFNCHIFQRLISNCRSLYICSVHKQNHGMSQWLLQCSCQCNSLHNVPNSTDIHTCQLRLNLWARIIHIYLNIHVPKLTPSTSTITVRKTRVWDITVYF